MLGRYVFGTVFVLGVAMLVAPDTAERPTAQVTRTETSPISLVVPKPTAMAVVAKQADMDAESAQLPVSDTPAPAGNAEIEYAVAEALALDDANETVDEPTQTEVASLGDETFEGLSNLDQFMPESEQAPETQDAPSSYLFVSGTRVNVRAGPSTQYAVVGSVVFGEPVELVSFEEGNWVQVRIGNGETTGFMSRKFLDEELTDG